MKMKSQLNFDEIDLTDTIQFPASGVSNDALTKNEVLCLMYALGFLIGLFFWLLSQSKLPTSI